MYLKTVIKKILLFILNTSTSTFLFFLIFPFFFFASLLHFFFASLLTSAPHPIFESYSLKRFFLNSPISLFFYCMCVLQFPTCRSSVPSVCFCSPSSGPQQRWQHSNEFWRAKGLLSSVYPVALATSCPTSGEGNKTEKEGEREGGLVLRQGAYAGSCSFPQLQVKGQRS